MELLNKTIECYFSRDWTTNSIQNIEKMLVAHLLEELFTFEVAKIGLFEYRENKDITVKKLLDLLTNFKITPQHISKSNVVSIIDLYFARQYDPTHSQSVIGNKKQCNWLCGCPSSEGPVGAINFFHKDHIIPKCSSNIGANERWFDVDENSQQLCEIHNTRVKRDNIALGLISRGVINP